MRLLERDWALTTLGELRAESAARGGRLVLVQGEAGLGKTSLLRTFRDSLPGGPRIVWGSCDPLTTPEPFAALLDVAPGLDEGLAQLLHGQAGVSDVARAFLAALRFDRGVVVLLDDLHWADEATIDVLRFAGRRIESTRALVVGALRDDELGRDHPLRLLLGDLATSRAVSRLRVTPLSVAAVAELARETDLDPGELHARTHGNPFFVTEVIAAAPDRLPATVRDAVLSRAARLSPQGRSTLEAAAAIGPAADPSLLAAVVTSAAEECVERGLLLVDGLVYRFRHELVRQVVLETLGPGRRRALHSRILAALVGADPSQRSVALLAHHAVEAGEGDSVLQYARSAAAAATAAGAHREAVAHLASAEPFAGRLSKPDRARFFEELAREQFVTARYDAGLAAYDQAIGLWRDLGDVREELRLLGEAAKSYIASGRNADARRLERRVAELDGGLEDGLVRAEALNTLAYLRIQERDIAAIELARAAIAMAPPNVVSPTVLMASITLGTIRLQGGDDIGLNDLRGVIDAAMEHGLDRAVAHAYTNLVEALCEVRRFGDAEPYFEAGRRYLTDRELDVQRLYLEGQLVTADVYRGRWPEADALGSTILSNRQNSVIGRILVLVALGRLRARRGGTGTWDLLDEALVLARPTGTLQRLGPVLGARAEAAWLEGDLDRAAGEAEAAYPLARRGRDPWQLGEICWWLRQAGQPTDDHADVSAPWRYQLAGRWREAATAWRSVGCPYEAARALLESDDPVEVEEARAAFDRLGAFPGAALAARRLRSLGIRSIPRGVRASTRANPLGLTARELEVAQLVADGLSNEQIATRLFVSRRTVDHHVAAVLAKFEVARRSEIRIAAARHGIDLGRGAAAN
ncbi:MAG: ATP-binding protein [Chloroflexota bacterium]